MTEMGKENAGSDKNDDPELFEKDDSADVINPDRGLEDDSDRERYLDSEAIRMMMSTVLDEPVPGE